MFQRLIFWIKSGANYWLVIWPFLISIVSVFALRPYQWGLNLFRLIGIAIEILGLMTVVVSLSRESKKYDHPGYCFAFLTWIISAKNIFVPAKISGRADVTLGAAAMSGVGRITATLAFNTIEEKVEYLLEKVKAIEASIDNINGRVEQIRNELSHEIISIQSALQNEITLLKGELKEKATVDYYLLVSGALLTVIGMVMTNVPDDLFVAWCSFSKP